MFSCKTHKKRVSSCCTSPHCLRSTISHSAPRLHLIPPLLSLHDTAKPIGHDQYTRSIQKLGGSTEYLHVLCDNVLYNMNWPVSYKNVYSDDKKRCNLVVETRGDCIHSSMTLEVRPEFGMLSVGRSTACDIIIGAPNTITRQNPNNAQQTPQKQSCERIGQPSPEFISRVHALIIRLGDHVFVIDVSSNEGFKFRCSLRSTWRHTKDHQSILVVSGFKCFHFTTNECADIRFTKQAQLTIHKEVHS